MIYYLKGSLYLIIGKLIPHARSELVHTVGVIFWYVGEASVCSSHMHGLVDTLEFSLICKSQSDKVDMQIKGESYGYVHYIEYMFLYR